MPLHPAPALQPAGNRQTPYDNTIACLIMCSPSQIRMLREASSQLDSVLIYASDHSESLGENGIYLHGMPYAFAPAVRRSAPMLIGPPRGYVRREQLQPDCLRTEAKLPVSHDFIYHTVLGAAELRNQAYDRRLDLIAGCRRGGGGEIAAIDFVDCPASTRQSESRTAHR